MSFMERILRRAGTPRKPNLDDGQAAESLAADFLAAQGLTVVAKNYRVRGGEIDLVCEERGSWVFVEVRLRRHRDFGGAAASITRPKQQRLVLAARHWLMEHGDRPCRFDCILFDALEIARAEWITNAFDAD